jgi:hypothetical protein
MGLLYQDIMNVQGLGGSTPGEKQAQLYERLGAPMGRYTGSYDQNIWLWNQIQKGNTGAPAQSSEAVSGIPTPTARTPFSEVLPFDKIFNPNLVTSLAESQVSPDIDRRYATDRRMLDQNLAASGAWRSGLAGVNRQNLSDTTERSRKEGVQGFTDVIKNYANDWYNRQYEQYNKNPSGFVMPKLPSYEEFIQGNPDAFNSYTSATNVPTTTTNPFNY